MKEKKKKKKTRNEIKYVQPYTHTLYALARLAVDKSIQAL